MCEPRTKTVGKGKKALGICLFHSLHMQLIWCVNPTSSGVAKASVTNPAHTPWHCASDLLLEE